MAYARFGKDSDIYVYDTDSGWICERCTLGVGERNARPILFTDLGSLRSHLLDHRQRGDNVPQEALDEIDTEFNAQPLDVRAILERHTQISKFMSLILRHEPEKFGVALDAEGYTPLSELLSALQSRMPNITLDDVTFVVEHVDSEKKRFTILDEDIRANYGHSLSGKIAHAPAQPPDVLFHGTTQAAVPMIQTKGLHPMRRQYVHLTPLKELALRVGARRGKPVLLTIDSRAAAADGILFYRANESFWLADHIPASYITRNAH